MKTMTRNAMALAVGSTMAAATFAADAGAFSTSGYFRAGTGTASKGTSRACYGLAGAGLKYRLGNECDIYGEVDLSTSFKADTIEYSVHVMPTLWNPGTDSGSASWGVGQMFVEGKGFDFAPNAKFWAGKRYYGRSDVHINDTKYTVQDGVGGGAYDIDVGIGKLGIAYFREDGANTAAPLERPLNRLNLELGGIGVNPDGKLRIVTAFTHASFEGGQGGAALTVQHDQGNFLGLGGGNTVWLQYAQGSANLNTNFGNALAGSDVKGARLTDTFSWQVGAFGGQAMASFAQNKADAGDSTLATAGGRLSYALTKHFKLVTEAGYSQLKPEGQATQKLTKFTIAPTLATGPGFWNRPELRLYATTAKWNEAAAANSANGLPTGKTSGTSVGVQVETWW
jgi:maltoporin